MVCPNKEICLLEKKYLESRIKKLEKDEHPVPQVLLNKLEKVNKHLEEINHIIEEAEKTLDETEIAIIGD